MCEIFWIVSTGVRPYGGDSGFGVIVLVMKTLCAKGVRKEETFSRPMVVPVRVRCGDRECLAYRDKSGVWIDFESGETIQEQVRIVRPSFH
jgi:hypothetical protein